jgi:hypothetical protein
VLGALVLAAVAVGSQLAGAPDPKPRPAPPPTSRHDPVPPTVPTARDWVAVASVCPVETDGRRRVTVRFVLVNELSQPVTIESVRPLLPQGGLRPRGTWVGGGDCHRLAPQVPGGPVPPGASRLVMMSFGLPRECPGPLAVHARARLSREGATRAADLSLLAGQSYASGLSKPGCGSRVRSSTRP